METPVWPPIISALAAVLSCTAAYIAFLFTRRQLRLAEGHSRVVAGSQSVSPWAPITSEYLDRRFRSTDPPVVDGSVIFELRVAKRRAVEKYRAGDPKPLQEWEKKLPSRESWRRASAYKQKGYENRIAFELGIAMEHIGIAIFAGEIDAKFFLGMAADQVLEDWPLWEAWIQTYREHNPELMHRNGHVRYHRRHAEWLVMLSALWMNQEYPGYGPLKVVIDDFGGLEEIKAKFRYYTLADASLMRPNVRREMARLSGVNLDD